MKVIFTADLHAGLPTSRFGGWDSRSGTYRSWSIAARTLGKIVDYANDNGVDLIVFSGDIFDRGTPHPEMVSMLHDELDKLDPSVSLILLEGNHDQWMITNTHRTPVEVYLGPRGNVFKVVKNFGVVEYEGLRIAAMPWLRVGGVSEVEELNRSMSDAIQSMSDQGAHVFTGHIMLDDLTLMRGSEQEMVTTVLETHCHAEDLMADVSWDLALLGHVHHRQSIGSSDKVGYIGSPYKVSFNEEDQPKGFEVVGFDSQMKVNSRLFVPVTGVFDLFTISADELVTDVRFDEVMEQANPGDMVRVVSRLDDYDRATEIIRELSACGVVARLETLREELASTHLTAAEVNPGMSPKRAMETYAQSNGYKGDSLDRVMGVFSEVVGR